MKQCLKQNMPLLVLAIFLNAFFSAGMVFIAIFLQKITDTALSGDMSAFIRIIFITVAYVLFFGLIGLCYDLSSKKLIRNLTLLLRKRIFTGVLRRSPSDFGDVNSADYISAMTNDIKLIEDSYIAPLMTMLQYSVIFCVTIVLLILMNPLITAALFATLIFMVLIPSLMGKKLQFHQEQYSKSMSVFTVRLKDILSGYEVIRAFSLLKHAGYSFDRVNSEAAYSKYRADRLFAINETISVVMSYLSLFTGIFIGSYLIIRGKVTPGTLLALIQLSSFFVNPVMIIMQNIPRVKSAQPILKRFDELSDYIDSSFTCTMVPAFNDRIEIKNLYFSYDEKSPVLKGINLSILKNKKYAIVGSSGCGKTTLLKLLIGNCPFYEGSITYDGTDIRKLDIGKVQELSSVIHQNVYLFDDNIRQNICLFEDFPESELEDAMSVSGVSGFVNQTSDGLFTPVGENGSSLSGGQRQRIAVARALIRKKPILILDEGTSAVDMQTAYDIESKLLSCENLTLITITHNLSEEFLSLYDQIIYIEKGQIVETGSLNELLSQNGCFAKFFKLQV